jgi:hypothetical protein
MGGCVRVLVFSVTSLVLATTVGCTTVPPLSGATNNFPFTANIPVHDIVQRVKCELSDALDEKTQQADFRWMADWTAKVDLTLEVNDTGGITPSATYIEPLRTIAGTAQSFNFGFGGTLNGSVDRTEPLSFALSLEELRKWRKELRKQEAFKGLPPDALCYPTGVNDLQVGLDLQSWIDSALGPVGAHDLAPGNHPDPGSVAKAPTPKATSPGAVPHGGPPLTAEQRAPLDAEMTSLQAQIKTFADNANKAAGDAIGYRVQVERLNTTTHAFDKRIRQLAYWAQQQAIASQQAATDGAKYKDDSNAASAPTIDRSKYEDDLKNVWLDLKLAALNSDAASQNSALAAKLANPDPPIDSITHSLQFIVTVGGSISPNWTLVHWKGPTTTGNLASLTGIRTHAINIALGSPTGGGLNEVNRVLGNQAFRQAVQTIGQ